MRCKRPKRQHKNKQQQNPEDKFSFPPGFEKGGIMKLRDALDYVIKLQEPAFSERVLIRWINQVEAEIQKEVLLKKIDDIIQYTANDMETSLIAEAPFDKLYPEYIIWRVMLAQNETERANNQQKIYKAAYLAYARYVCRQRDGETP